MTDPAPSLRAGRREEMVALVLLALGSGLLLVAAGQAWGAAVVSEPGLPALAVTATGRDVAVEAAAAGVLGLAGVAGLVATARLGRVLVGLVLLLAGGVAAAVSASFPRRAGGLLDVLLADRTGVAAAVTTTTTSWWVVSLVGAVLVAGCGVLAVVRGGSWPRLGARYERPGPVGATPPSAQGAAGAVPPSPSAAPTAASSAADTWAALDRGEDPTA